MNRSSSKPDVNEDNTESDRIYSVPKRRCQSPSFRRSLSNSSGCVFINLTADRIEENKEKCKFCGKQEKLLKTFNCPSLHCFCLNCIFNWTQKHIQDKTPPRCLVIDCEYSLKIEDLDDLPIAIKDHQILLQLIELKPLNTKTNNNRIKCDKCDLYIDQHNFYIHQNECLGRSLTIPCEVCYCPVLIHDYEEHMIICNNDDNTALAQFLVKHLQNPNIEEKNIKLFINTWQRKYRRSIDVYEIIEEFNQPIVSSNELCDVCKTTIPSEDIYSINCDDHHSLCILCFKQHVLNQMNKDEILTCYQCTYHLQDRDLSENRLFTNEQIILYQKYQNKKVIDLYYQLYGAEDTVNTEPTVEQQNTIVTATTNMDDTPRRKCELCSKQHSYGNIFVLNCNCKICYDCFANDLNRQRTTTNELLLCSLCRTSIKRNDIANLRLPSPEIDAIQLYQQNKLFEFEHAVHFNKQKSDNQTADNNNNDDNDHDDLDLDMLLFNQQQCLPKYWTLPMLTNFSRHILDPQSTEHKFVSDKFIKSWSNLRTPNLAAGPITSTRMPAMPMRPVPPTSLFLTPTSNPTLPPPHYQTALQQPFGPVSVSVNQNNRLPTNPNPPSSIATAMSTAVAMNHNFGPWPYPTPPGINTLPQPSQTLPNTLYPPHMPPTAPVSYTQTNISNQILSHRTMARARRNIVPPVNHGNTVPTIIQVERIQNQRWFKQYSAHDHEFRQKLGKQTEQWLFHGCDERSSKNIEMECFNRSYAGQHAVAYGQGCYFARDSLYSHSYALPDRNGIRRMFLTRVLVGNTAQGNSTMRVPPPGFDTTGDGHSIFVTFHDSQAYAEYLISYR